MQHHRLHPLASSGDNSCSPDCVSIAATETMQRRPSAHGQSRWRQDRGVTLVEAMFSLLIMAMFMLGFIGTFVQSRRVTESSVLHAAATSMIYGIIEQIKELDYTTLLPSSEVDPSAPTGGGAPVTPYLRIRIDQSTIKWLTVVRTATGSTPRGPLTTPAPTATVAGAVDNLIGSIPLSTVTGTKSQEINLNIWIWIDEIANAGTWSAEGTPPVTDASEVKKVTVIYTYKYQDGISTRTVRDREVFLRTLYN